MSGWNLEIEGASIVLLGSLNPAIFQPFWLAKHNLISEADAKDAEVHIVHPEVSALGLGAGLELEVSRERFTAATANPASFLPLRDLVLGVLNVLEHTPLTQMGLNYLAHYRAPSEAAWHELGHALAPKERWSHLVEKPGLRSLLMMGKLAESPNATLFVKVEPSQRVTPGVFIEATEDLRFDERSTAPFARTLGERWQPSLTDAKRIANELLGRTT
jgi:hypothetical protein